jgi:hypothetical protein
MQARLQKLHEHADGALGEELLQVWAAFKLEERLPIYIFYPELLVNVEPSRKDLKSTISILKSGAEP